MNRSVAQRVLAWMLALAVGLASPAAAIAHGQAHSEAGHEHIAKDLARAEFTVATGLDASHPHVTLNAAVSARPDAPRFAGTAKRDEIPAPSVVDDPVARLLIAAPPRAKPSSAPPPRPRGPPID